MSIEKCLFKTDKPAVKKSEIQRNDLQSRIHDLKVYSENISLEEQNAELHTCSDCLTENVLCQKCSECGQWTCQECATTLTTGEVICLECYNAQ